MKALIYAATHKHRAREEERLIKSIKGSLELAKTQYTNDPFDNFDVAHFLNFPDLSKIKDLKRDGIPVVMSALYCENERESMLAEPHGEKRVLKDNARRCLNEADLVLVPSEISKTFLEKEGVLSKIKVFPAPVRLANFTMNERKQTELVSRYYHRREEPFVLCLGDFLNKKDMNNFLEVTELAPFARFYFLGANYSLILAGKYIKLTPDNVVLSTLVDDDIYRATLLKAKMLLVLNDFKADATNIHEAMAAKTQVVAYLKNMKGKCHLKDGINCYAKTGINELVDTIDLLVKGKLKKTTERAYKEVQEYSLEKTGKRLLNIYRSLLKEKHHD
ncbi:MAG: glycosyltransferase [Bacilli bacterium]|nr:glycosyltransferase [Bacilli bacterium]